MVQAAIDSADPAVRVGVVGVGVMGSNHARVLAELPGVDFVGVADPDRDQREFVAGVLGCPAVEDLDALLERGVDALTIATPTHLHRDIALTAIRRRIHVLVEKPIASSPAEARDIVAAAHRVGVTLMVGHVERFNPAVQAIKEALKNEDILSIAITRVGPFPPRMSNVGVVIDLAVHDIDLIRWFTDSDIVEVQPQLSSAMAEREDIALLQFRTASGVLAHINTNWLTPFKARTVHVATRQKYVMGDLLTRQVTECFGFQPDGSYSMRHLSVGHAEPLRAELSAFVEAIRERKTPAVTGEEAVASLEIAMRCLVDRTVVETAPSPRRRVDSSADAHSASESRDPMNQHARLGPIPFIDVAAQRRRLGGSVDEAIARVLAHCQFVMGPEVPALEADLAAFCGARHAIGAASGTDALLLALMAKGIGRGDAVFCPAFTFCATAEAIALTGATPVFVDVDEATFNIDSKGLEGAIAAAKRHDLRPKAIVPVDLFGLPADYDSIGKIAAAEQFFVLADAAQSFGASYEDRRVGALAAATATSFFPSKPLGCYGDGGAVFTNDDALAAIIRSLRIHGQGADKYDNVRIGITGRLDTIQAAVLIEKLRIFADEIAARDLIARRYHAALSDVAIVPQVPDGCSSVWAQYTIRVAPEQRGELAALLRAKGIPTAIYYPKPLHRQEVYRQYPVAGNGLPVTDRLAAEVLSLPMHAYLDEPTQDRIVAAVRRSLGR